MRASEGGGGGDASSGDDGSVAAGAAAGVTMEEGQSCPRSLHRGASGKDCGAARSAKVLRTDALVNNRSRSPSCPDTRSVVEDQGAGAVGAGAVDSKPPDAAAGDCCAAATSERPEPAEMAETDPPSGLDGDGGISSAGGSDSGGGGGTWWVVPLRIRAASGSQAAREQTAAGVAEGGWGRCGGGSGGLPGEAVHSFLLAEESTSIALRGISREPAHGSENGVGVAEGGVGDTDGAKDRDNDVGGEEGGGEGRPYLVVNDGHSGFFTVQYECERSWALALSAVRERVLNECETMGFVYDLILGLHKGVLGDRESASVDIAGSCNEERGDGDGDGDGGGNYSNSSNSWDVPRLFSRLKNVVKLLSRDRSQPAWCAGQLFLWELLVMCASDALSEVCEVSLRRRRLAPAWQHPRASDRVSTRAAASTAAAAVAAAAAAEVAAAAAATAAGVTTRDDAQPIEGDAGDHIESPEQPPDVGQVSRSSHQALQRRRVGDSEAQSFKARIDGAATEQAGGERNSLVAAVSEDRVVEEGEVAAAASASAAASAAAASAAASAAATVAADRTAAWFAIGAECAAAQERLSKIAADVDIALENVKEDVRWHRERVASGVEHANEALQSLRGMRERLRSSRAQMTLVAKTS